MAILKQKPLQEVETLIWGTRLTIAKCAHTEPGEYLFQQA